MHIARLRSIAVVVALAAGLLVAPNVMAAGSAEKGKGAYVKHGCWQCHGFVGQGGIAGPKLAPSPMPAEAFSAFVRFTNRAMPPYQKAILPDADLADIHAWLLTIPKSSDHKSIPLLNP